MKSLNGNRDNSIKIRLLECADVNSVAEIHLRAFPGFFLSFLGYSFLRQYYLSIVKLAQYGLVATKGNAVLGFAVGIDCDSGFYKKLLKSKGIRFALASLQAIIKKPSVLPRLIRALGKHSPIQNDGVPTVQLTSIGVMPEMLGCGVGHLLIEEFSSHIAQRGFKRIVFETDAEKNERVCRFYMKEGYKVRRNYMTFEGRKMLEFEKNLGDPRQSITGLPVGE